MSSKTGLKSVKKPIDISLPKWNSSPNPKSLLTHISEAVIPLRPKYLSEVIPSQELLKSPRKVKIKTTNEGPPRSAFQQELEEAVQKIKEKTEQVTKLFFIITSCTYKQISSMTVGE